MRIKLIFMSEIFYAIADFFGLIFIGIEAIGNTINYIYIFIIFTLLVIWAREMIKHRKEGSEHADS